MVHSESAYALKSKAVIAAPCGQLLVVQLQITKQSPYTAMGTMGPLNTYFLLRFK